VSTYNAQNAYDTLNQLSNAVGSAASTSQLTTIIDEALAVPAPDGTPSVISELGNAYTQASNTLCDVTTDLSDVQNQLPAAWSGDAAESANQEVSRLAEVSNSAATFISSAGQALTEWATLLQQAQRSDTSGRDSLKQADQIIQNMDPLDYTLPLGLVRGGINSMANGAGTAVYGAGVTSDELRGDINLHAIKPNAIVLS
jgi:uncharacterized protein YukE